MKISPLSDFLNIEMGQSPEAGFVNKDLNGMPLLNGPAEFTDRYPVPVQYTTNAKRFANKSDILFCVRGSTTGRMNIADRRYAIGRGLAAISHKKGEQLNSFVRGLFDVNLKSLLGGTLGSVFPNLTKDQLFDFKCSIPSVDIQRKIAHVLSCIDNKIALNTKINDNLPHNYFTFTWPFINMGNSQSLSSVSL
jgi:type I restriction enzyme, S subunit